MFPRNWLFTSDVGYLLAQELQNDYATASGHSLELMFLLKKFKKKNVSIRQ